MISEPYALHERFRHIVLNHDCREAHKFISNIMPHTSDWSMLAAAAAWIDAPESATSTRAYLKQLVQVVQARFGDTGTNSLYSDYFSL